MDEWSKQEKLCLASAVAYKGKEQKNNEYFRAVHKMMGANRPLDWFTQTSCAAQYSELVKIYANSNSEDEGIIADFILKSLTKERIDQLKNEISKAQQEYAKIHAELKLFQAGNLSDRQIQEMWREIEKENEMKRIEEMKLENQLREREERKQQEQDRAWHSVGGIYGQKVQTSSQPETEFDDSKQLGNKLLQLPQQGTASPLLSSLLKSPTATSSTTAGSTVRSTAPTITTLLTGGIIDPNKPVLTLKNTIPSNQANALTRPISGPMSANNNDSILSLQGQNNMLSPSQSAPTLSMLLEKNKVNSQQQQQQQIPCGFTDPSESIHLPHESLQSSNEIEIKIEQQQQETIPDSNNEEVPMDIEEDIIGGTVVADDEGNQSPTKEEEQQLMEVFKNIGNIDELAGILNPAILEEEAFLKDVESLMDDGEEVENVDDFEANDANNIKKEIEFTADSTNVNQEMKTPSDNASNEKSADAISLKEVATEESCQEMEKSNQEIVQKDEEGEQEEEEGENEGNGVIIIESKKSPADKQDPSVENISSDDSNDNVPLVALSTSQEKKSIGQSLSPNLKEDSVLIEDDLKEVVNIAEDEANQSVVVDNECNDVENKINQITEDHTSSHSTDNQKDDYEGILAEMEGGTKDGQISHKSSISDSSDVIIIPTDDDDDDDDGDGDGNGGDVDDDDDNDNDDDDECADNHDDDINDGKKVDPSSSPKKILDSDKNENQKSNSSVVPALDIIENHLSSSLPRPTNLVEVTETISAPPIPTETPTISIDTDDDSSTMDAAVCIGAVASGVSIKKNENYQQPKTIQQLSTPTIIVPTSNVKKIEIDDEKDNKTLPNEATPQNLSTYATPKQTLSIRKLRNRSESPMVDDDASDHSTTVNAGRSRRRYSMTPVTDSIPSSPASSDDRESKACKKLLMNIYNSLISNRNAAIFMRPFTEEQAPQYKLLCYRPMDFQIIKKNIESGNIRSIHEFQRDVMLMCQNVLMIFKKNTTYYTMAKDLVHECSQIKDPTADAKSEKEKEKDKSTTTTATTTLPTASSSGHSSGVKVRGSSRKSQRLP